MSSLTTLATICMWRENNPSSMAPMSCVRLTLSFEHVHWLSRYFKLCRPLPLALLPSIFHLPLDYPGHSFSSHDHREIRLLLTNWPAVLNTSKLIFFSVHYRSIRKIKFHLSLYLSFIVFDMVELSHPHNKNWRHVTMKYSKSCCQLDSLTQWHSTIRVQNATV